MAVVAENQDSIVFKSNEVIVVASCRAIDLELVRVLLEYLHVLSADDDQRVIVPALRHNEQGALAEELEVLALGRQATALNTRLKDNHCVEVIFIQFGSSGPYIETSAAKSILVLGHGHLLVGWPEW